MPRISIILTTALIAGALMLAGCGGGGTSSTDKTATAAANAGATGTPVAGATAGATSSGAATAAATASTGASSGNMDDFNAAKAKFIGSTFKGSYTVTATGGADSGGNGTMVLYKDGQNRFRFDVTATQDGKDVAIISIEDGATSVFCLRDAGDLSALLGVEAGQGVCFNNDPSAGTNPIGSLSQSLNDFQNQNVTLIGQSTRTVAGKSGDCFRTQNNDDQTIETTCFSSDGAILYAETEGPEGNKLEATEIGGAVSGGDFNVPYAIRDLPGTGG
ncbi:MAG: hypothetical protein HYX50_02355 [Chloroflexi bacterium]|nr:hypothetical protein [Chloroflexota bacterium]